MYRLPEELQGLYSNGTDTCIGRILGIILCERGRMDVIVHGKKYTISSNCTFILHVNVNLRVRYTSDDFKGMAIMAQPEYGFRLSSKAMEPSSLIYFHNNPLLQFTPEEYGNVMALVDMLKNEIDDMSATVENPMSRMLRNEIIRSQVETFVYKGMYIYMTRYMNMLDLPQTVNKVMQNFLVSVNNNHRMHRDVAFYAREQGMSPSNFSSVIHRESGMSALQCISMAVIDDAKQMLGFSNMSIKEISILLNFSTQGFFGKYFKQYVGVSPKDYREGKIGT